MSEETGTRARTRRAILDAAIAVLNKDTSASLGDVANAAGVGRTTVHRYFPERSDLLTAIGADVLERIELAAARARLDQGDALEALDRLCQEYFDLGDVMMLLFNNPSLISDEDWEEESDADRALNRLIERGQAEGTIDPEMPATWINNIVWALLYASWQQTEQYGSSKHTSIGLCLRSLRKTLAV
ncbi:TetR/AcrR family transcriptional regulator [Amycolatopsis sp. 195334CR]|uniref:TetR/AcrR family transcriptional regulator n=1 Tax=Amycolatopsis sp. 195334CR TaxID=2814588 RepID=UPI001A8C80EF|nr:TetR/AcrR family transcriptional regulator [Amycolatopsis sp. 195334CR]MBN6039298.1 TetR/AcrR family transcriptional regulator [Amycolatopsis sp. 195334CR]